MNTTHQKMAQALVSREWTRDTERFFHFQLLHGSVLTVLGLGWNCKSQWISLNVRELQNTYMAGSCWTSFSQPSILQFCYWPSLTLCVQLFCPTPFHPYFSLSYKYICSSSAHGTFWNSSELLFHQHAHPLPLFILLPPTCRDMCIGVVMSGRLCSMQHPFAEL